MNHLTTIKPKTPVTNLADVLRKAEEAKAKTILLRALQDPKAWAAGAVNDEIGKHLSKLGTDAMYRMAAIAEGMLGYYLDYYREVEKLELDFNPILDKMNPSKKERKQLTDSLKWAKEKLEKNFANFYITNKQMVDMCNRVDEAQQEKLQELEDEIYDDVIQSYNTKHLRVETYLTKGATSEAYWQTPIELCKQLALASKGQLYLTPQALAKELNDRGFKQGNLMQSGKFVNAYYVELVK